MKGGENQPILLWNRGPVWNLLPPNRLNEWQVSSRRTGFIPSEAAAAAAAAVLGGTGHTGPFHSTSRTFRSNVQGEQFSAHGIMSKCNACILLLIASVLDEGYWMGPNQAYQKI
jgi:hypothetical protein